MAKAFIDDINKMVDWYYMADMKGFLEKYPELSEDDYLETLDVIDNEKFMRKPIFEALAERYDFETALRCYESVHTTFITSYDCLKDYAVEQLQGYDFNIGLALHILKAIYNSEGDSMMFYYDYTAGTCCTPACLNTVADVEKYISFA